MILSSKERVSFVVLVLSNVYITVLLVGWYTADHLRDRPNSAVDKAVWTSCCLQSYWTSRTLPGTEDAEKGLETTSWSGRYLTGFYGIFQILKNLLWRSKLGAITFNKLKAGETLHFCYHHKSIFPLFPNPFLQNPFLVNPFLPNCICPRKCQIQFGLKKWCWT